MKRIAGVFGIAFLIAFQCAASLDLNPAGKWQEEFLGGGPGQPGNVITAEGRNYRFTATLAYVDGPPLQNGDTWIYKTIYTDGVLELYNQPWGKAYTITFAEVIVYAFKPLDGSGDSFNMEGEGSVEGCGSCTVAIQAGSIDVNEDPDLPGISGRLLFARVSGVEGDMNVEIKAPSTISLKSQGLVPVTVTGAGCCPLALAENVTLNGAIPVDTQYANGTLFLKFAAPDLNLKKRKQTLELHSKGVELHGSVDVLVK